MRKGLVVTVGKEGARRPRQGGSIGTHKAPGRKSGNDDHIRHIAVGEASGSDRVDGVLATFAESKIQAQVD